MSCKTRLLPALAASISGLVSEKVRTRCMLARADCIASSWTGWATTTSSGWAYYRTCTSSKIYDQHRERSAGCTSSVLNATSPAGSTTSSAAGPAGRATTARPGFSSSLEDPLMKMFAGEKHAGACSAGLGFKEGDAHRVTAWFRARSNGPRSKVEQMQLRAAVRTCSSTTRSWSGSARIFYGTRQHASSRTKGIDRDDLRLYRRCRGRRREHLSRAPELRTRAVSPSGPVSSWRCHDRPGQAAPR